ncbi:MAG: phytanoyl-CoA dioxygenase family protein [Hyphomicrobiaceae bacterium]
MAEPTPATAELPSDADTRRFAENGVILLKGVFTDWVEPLRAGIEALMRSPSRYERSYTPKDGTARFFQDLCNWQRIPEFHDFVMRSPAGAIAARLMGSATGRFFHDHVLVKEPGTSIVTPWHQDQPYYCHDGRQSVSFWIPLDPVPRETTLECVPGSHRWGVDHRPKRFDGSDLYAGDTAKELPDIEAERDRYGILGWAMQPGDAVAFNFRTVHGAPANTGQASRRRVFSARFVGDDAVFVDRKGKGSPPLEHLTLRTGEPLDGPDFPVVYRA